MRLPVFFIACVSLIALASSGCKTSDLIVVPPSPASILNGTRDKLVPFRFNLSTDPAAPTTASSFVLKVHVIDASDQPADGVDLEADLSLFGADQGAQHINFTGRGHGDYDAEVSLGTAGSWDMDMTASKDGKTRQQRLTVEVGG